MSLVLYKKNQSGFTLIEIMVSVSIFAIIMVVGMGALVNVTQSYQVSHKEKEVHDSLNFILESMTREIRLGKNHRIFASLPLSIDPQTPGTNGSGNSIGFLANDGRGYFVYSFGVDGKIQRSVYSLSTGQLIQRDNLSSKEIVDIVNLRFSIIGMNSYSSGDLLQPAIMIQVQARAKGETRVSTIQTLVSQRSLDV